MTPEKNAQIFLNGTDAYGRYYDVFVKHEKKSNFKNLFVNVDTAIVHVNKTTAKRYIEKIISLGYKVLSNEEYDIFTIRIKVAKV